MSLPTRDNLLTTDYSHMGQPFVQVTSKTGIDLNTMDYSYLGQPFWTVPMAGGGEEEGIPIPVVQYYYNRLRRN